MRISDVSSDVCSSDLCLEVGDLASERGGVQGVAVGEEFGGLCWGEDAGGQEPVQWRGGLVVGPTPTPVAVAAIPLGLLGRGQVVEPVVDQSPQPVQHGPFLGGVVAVVEAVLADQVVVLGLDGGLVVLLVGPEV